MGAVNFSTYAKGKTAREAFESAREEAQYLYGHGGYTGTIAEKSRFVMIDLPAGKTPNEYADELMDNGDRRINDKWGPAGCIASGQDTYVFFGWASE